MRIPAPASHKARRGPFKQVSDEDAAQLTEELRDAGLLEQGTAKQVYVFAAENPSTLWHAKVFKADEAEAAFRYRLDLVGRILSDVYVYVGRSPRYYTRAFRRGVHVSVNGSEKQSLGYMHVAAAKNSQVAKEDQVRRFVRDLLALLDRHNDLEAVYGWSEPSLKAIEPEIRRKFKEFE